MSVSQPAHEAFLTSRRKHVLMITNHGLHRWQVIPGLPDTGGQNVFVNQFSGELARQGFRVTITNRGGYPNPRTAESRQGLRYKDAHQRILYLEDGLNAFVRKEDMDPQIPRLAAWLEVFLAAEGTEVDVIFSHYWDGAKVGALYNRTLAEPVKHVWIPHSLGTLKKRNVEAAQWEALRIDERIAIERMLIQGGELDSIVATSFTIKQALREAYGYDGGIPFLPPCVDTGLFYPRDISDSDAVWDFLSQRSGLPPEQVRRSKIVTEISRTDTTKRKDVLIKAFAHAQKRIADSLLIVAIDQRKQDIAQALEALINDLGIRSRVAVVGSVWDLLPKLYAVTDVYCTPSVMEGFGMSAQEAAATGLPVVASDRVPFVTEYLLEETVKTLVVGSDGGLVRQGAGGIVVPADHISGFAYALEMLLSNDALREKMGANAYRVTVPYFSWQSRVPTFLNKLAISSGDVDGNP